MVDMNLLMKTFLQTWSAENAECLKLLLHGRSENICVLISSRLKRVFLGNVTAALQTEVGGTTNFAYSDGSSLDKMELLHIPEILHTIDCR
ncbi:hypothetical protein KXD40_003043 [Peronospora effusa]|uniref:Uncharacterized protein n=1 Tax=Peronospora effusa TaxID=542832 RepID=A0A3M6VRD7_9STRA|nr:hypothetical protein DD238_006263 [Peronospora effusa]RQM11352.1 hypothetical protein DD237_006682 [Peronospora effusa]UIZ29218.1 hypothetical protein KXD40_003043 [Peronospora effusa]